MKTQALLAIWGPQFEYELLLTTGLVGGIGAIVGILIWASIYRDELRSGAVPMRGVVAFPCLAILGSLFAIILWPPAALGLFFLLLYTAIT